MKEKVDYRSLYLKSNDVEYDLMDLRLAEKYLNDELRMNGYVFLNEVYDRLGLRLDINRLLSISDPRELWWAYDGDKIDFAAKENEDTGIIELDFNIDID